ncbi:NTP transferase domain-containing protein [Desulfofundulus thermobenzoicus]|uniref:NTP transferase domain-containing protein n=1 Tax=Desulfofundulus thermobenzoicus TaxID=29376 RepID=A0A6N7IWE3_9FIRM|nr:NTP transferase domain-containing protein [Desulfofundulus thermobenzoicus]
MLVFFAVIMAGGTGQRFWPLSRRDRPKQFLSLVGERTMLQLTFDRLAGLVPPERVLVITGAGYVDTVREQLPELPPENIVAEPCGRDTAAAVGLGALHVLRKDPRGVMAVLPADHYIAHVRRFQQVLQAGVSLAADGRWLVTMGITPTRPDTGYGYICQGELLAEGPEVPVYRVEKFLEKPALDRARQFLAEGRYLWNSGMFIWRADLIYRLIDENLPSLAAGLAEIGRAMGINAPGRDGEPAAAGEEGSPAFPETPPPADNRAAGNRTGAITGSKGSGVKTVQEAGAAVDFYNKVISRVYPELPKVSIDYGVMEKAANVLVLPGDFGWDDVGSWPALERCREAEENGNIIEARGVFLETRNSIIHAPGRLVATLGVEDLVVVDDGECLLVCHKDRAQELKRLTAALQEAGLDHAL